MLDIKRIKKDFDVIEERMALRGEKDFSLKEVVDLDNKRIELLQVVEKMKNQQKTDSKLIPEYKKAGKDTTELMNDLKKLSSEISERDAEVKTVEEELYQKMLRIPNVPDARVQKGLSDSDNVEVRKWGNPTHVGKEMKAHWDIGCLL